METTRPDWRTIPSTSFSWVVILWAVTRWPHQPTLSRFENGVGPRALYRMGEALADVVIDRHRKRLGRRVRQITIDLDPTDDPTHGQQQLTFFQRPLRHVVLPAGGRLRHIRQ